MFEECFGEGPFIFRINETGNGPPLLSQVCIERGWREFNPENGDNWNLWWKTSGFSSSHHRSLYAWQYINHIPKGSSICRKDNLVRYLRCMRKVFGSIYDFSPDGFNLPLEYTKLAAECNRSKLSGKEEMNGNLSEEKPVWICKPVAQSQGKGIFLFRKLSELTYDTNTIVQRYIEKPFLIGGYKFDLRLYVCVPSYHPMTIYMYKEGLVRFGTDKFSLNDLRNPFRHLTNSSINKLGPGYPEMKDRIGSGCKWTLRQLRRYFQQANIADWLLWQRIVSLVVLTLLSHVAQIPPTVNCFEFFGFDVLIDSCLRPWLLEVNLSPALGNDCDADRSVKKPMLHDMFDLLGLPLYNTGLSVFNAWLDDMKENDEVEEEGEKLCKQTPKCVVNAAGKWRQKQRKMSSKNHSKGICQKKVISKKHSIKSSHCHHTFVNKLQHNKNLGEEWKSSMQQSGKWGNGRNWNKSPHKEGGWVRLWPMSTDNCSEEQVPQDSSKSVKNMVHQIVKFNKICKDIVKKNPGVPECVLTEILMEDMNLATDVWIPPL